MPDLFPREAIDFLRACRYDPSAVPCFDLRSRCLNWSDEHYPAFASLCRTFGCTASVALFAYRTALLVGRPTDESKDAWDEVRRRCPGWIGFRPDRVAPNAELRAYVGWAADEF